MKYSSVCKSLEGRVDVLIAKLAKEKYEEFAAAENPEWTAAICYLHKGNNASYSSVTDESSQPDWNPLSFKG